MIKTSLFPLLILLTLPMDLLAKDFTGYYTVKNDKFSMHTDCRGRHVIKPEILANLNDKKDVLNMPQIISYKDIERIQIKKQYPDMGSAYDALFEFAANSWDTIKEKTQTNIGCKLAIVADGNILQSPSLRDRVIFSAKISLSPKQILFLINVLSKIKPPSPDDIEARKKREVYYRLNLYQTDENYATQIHSISSDLINIGEVDNAITLLKDSIEKNTGHTRSSLVSYLADAYEKKGQQSKIIELLQKEINSNSGSWMLRDKLSKSYAETGKYKQAYEELKQFYSAFYLLQANTMFEKDIEILKLRIQQQKDLKSVDFMKKQIKFYEDSIELNKSKIGLK